MMAGKLMLISDTNVYSKLRIVETELWDFNNGENSVIQPTLNNADYTLGVALFQVPFDFCSILNDETLSR